MLKYSRIKLGSGGLNHFQEEVILHEINSSSRPTARGSGGAGVSLYLSLSRETHLRSMEQYSIIGVAGDTVFVEGELLGDQLIAMFPKISFVKDMRSRRPLLSLGHTFGSMLLADFFVRSVHGRSGVISAFFWTPCIAKPAALDRLEKQPARRRAERQPVADPCSAGPVSVR